MGVLEDYTKLLRNQKQAQQTHKKSFTQDKSIADMDREGLDAVKAGARQWPGDVLGFVGDLADGAYYAGRRIAGGQSQKSIPSLGAGAAIRRKLGQPLGMPAPRKQAEMTSLDEDPRTEAVRFLNPLMGVDPLAAANSPIGRGALAAFAAANGMPGDMAMLGILKSKGGNWRNDDISAVLRALKENLGETDPVNLRRIREEFKNPSLGVEGEALGKWVDGPLRKYITRDMATEGDPLAPRELPEDLNFAKGGLVNTNILSLHGYN